LGGEEFLNFSSLKEGFIYTHPRDVFFWGAQKNYSPLDEEKK